MNLNSRDVFGAEIQYFRLDPRYWEAVLDRFVETGLRCVTTYVQWSTHLVGPPDAGHPAGVLDFEGRTDPRLNVRRFLELVTARGLDLNFRCGPFCCNEMIHGGYPEWLVLGDPGLMVWDYQNRTTQGYWIGKREGSQPSYLHPEYLAWCAKWLAEVDRVVIDNLKSRGGCVTMLNLDNEVSYIVQDGFLTSDYNPVNVAPGGFYHQFLAEKYGDAARLSEAYGHAYRRIEEVAAPRRVPATVGRDFAYYADWCAFKTWLMSAYIRRLRDLHEANGVRDVTFMTNFNPHRPEGIPTRLPDFERATGAGGIAGYDFYRGAFMSYSGYHSMARVLKLMNATLRYTWSAEFMSGTWNKDLSKASRVSDDHMRFMARCALAQGCKAIDWFMFHDRICWGDAPVSSHGHARPNLAVLTETPRLLFDQIRGWDGLKPQADVAVIYDLAQHQHTYLGDMQPCHDDNLYVGAPTVDGVEAGRASKEYEGLLRLVEEAGYQAHVVDSEHAVDRLGDYPLLFLPGSPVIGAAALAALPGYVAAGGTLVVSGPWPQRDACGRPVRFLDLPTPEPPAAGALTLPLGKGEVLWHAAPLAQAAVEQEELSAIAFVSGLLERHVARPQARIAPVGEVSWTDWQTGGGHRLTTQPRNFGTAVLHRGPEDRILFVLNHYPEAAAFRLTFGRDAVRALLDLDTGTELPVRDNAVTLDIDRKSGAVFRMLA